jgi:flagellar export protein FliJ
MKAFRFPLDRALHLRRMQLEIEQVRLQQIQAEILRIHNSVAALEQFGVETRNWISGNRSLDSGSICTVADFQQRSRQVVLAMAHRTRDLRGQAEAQKARTLEARRRVKLLEILRESRYAEWLSEADREQETFAAEAFLARWSVTH